MSNQDDQLAECCRHIEGCQRIIAAMHNEIERLRAEVAVLKQSAAKLHDIAASGADPTKRRRMLDQMAEESFAEYG